MPLPPGTSQIPAGQLAAGECRRAFVNTRSGAAGAWSVRGPYICHRVPMSGNLQMPAGKSNQVVTIDERWRVPVASGARARSIIRDIASNLTYEVVFVQNWPTYIEAYVKRSAAD